MLKSTRESYKTTKRPLQTMKEQPTTTRERTLLGEKGKGEREGEQEGEREGKERERERERERRE